MGERLLKTDEAAAFLGMAPRTLENWRTAGDGPKYVRVGPKLVRYDPEDLRAWAEARRQENTTLEGI